MNKFLLLLVLLATWFLLSGFFKPLFIFYGITSSLICLFFYSKMVKSIKLKATKEKTNYFSFSFLFYAVWLMKEIAVSSFCVAVEMWRHTPEVSPELKWVKHKMNKESSMTVYANSITLTPGTVSVSANKKEVLVHALQKSGIKDLESNKMHDKIKNSLEG